MDRGLHRVHIAVLTVADAREDTTQLVCDRLIGAGHAVVARETIKDSVQLLRAQFLTWIADPLVDAVIAVGGVDTQALPTALEPLITRHLPGFADLFRMIAYEEIGTSAMLLHTLAAQCKTTFVFCLPPSNGAARIALDKILLPQLDTRTKPHNVASRMPRIAAQLEPGFETTTPLPARPTPAAAPAEPRAISSGVPVASAFSQTQKLPVSLTPPGGLHRRPATVPPEATVLGPPPLLPATAVAPEKPPSPPSETLPPVWILPKTPAKPTGVIPSVKAPASTTVTPTPPAASTASVPAVSPAPAAAASPTPAKAPTGVIAVPIAAFAKESTDVGVAPAPKPRTPTMAPPPVPVRPARPPAAAAPAIEPPVIAPPAPPPPPPPPLPPRNEAPTYTTERYFEPPRRRRSKTKRLIWIIAVFALAAAAGAGLMLLIAGHRRDAIAAERRARTPRPVPLPEATATLPAPAPDAPPTPAIVETPPVDAAPLSARDVPVVTHATAPAHSTTGAHTAARPAGAGTSTAKEPVVDHTPTSSHASTPVPVPVEDGCDEVSCVLDRYARACCERYRPTDPGPKAQSGLPETLDKAMVRSGIEKMKPVVIKCGEAAGVKGTVKIHVHVTPAGTIDEASVSSSPDAALGACVAAAVKKATFAKSQSGAAFTYPFAF